MNLSHSLCSPTLLFLRYSPLRPRIQISIHIYSKPLSDKWYFWYWLCHQAPLLVILFDSVVRYLFMANGVLCSMDICRYRLCFRHCITRMCIYVCIYSCIYISFMAREPGPPYYRCFTITHNDAPQAVEYPWTSDQLVAETSAWQHTTLTTDRNPRCRRDSNSQSLQASGRRPMP